jgi:hypothetical protein
MLSVHMYTTRQSLSFCYVTVLQCDVSFFDEVVRDNANSLCDLDLVSFDMDFRRLRCLVWCRDTGEI